MKVKNGKPILFSTPMVQAIIAGRKTQTRRIVQTRTGVLKQFPSGDISDIGNGLFMHDIPLGKLNATAVFKPKYAVGDDVWVRETWAEYYDQNGHPHQPIIAYRADGIAKPDKWKPSIFMPKEAARIWLSVTSVRAERLCSITEEDAIAEGIEFIDKDESRTDGYRLYGDHKIGDVLGRKAVTGTALESFETLWESINGEGSWEKNPYVWVYDFEVKSVKH